MLFLVKHAACCLYTLYFACEIFNKSMFSTEDKKYIFKFDNTSAVGTHTHPFLHIFSTSFLPLLGTKAAIYLISFLDKAPVVFFFVSSSLMFFTLLYDERLWTTQKLAHCCGITVNPHDNTVRLQPLASVLPDLVI